MSEVPLFAGAYFISGPQIQTFRLQLKPFSVLIFMLAAMFSEKTARFCPIALPATFLELARFIGKN